MDLLLKDFKPVSELRVPEHRIEKAKFPVYDAHSHWGRLLLGDNFPALYNTKEIVESLKEVGVKRIVNLDGFSDGELDKMLAKTEEAGDFIRHFGNIDATRVNERGFETMVFQTLRDSKAKGIAGLKFWKVIGLSYQNPDGTYLRPDDERLSCIWQCAAEMNLPVLFHIADPVAFFKPIDRFNERIEELGDHPDWAFNDPGLYSFDTLMQMQYNLLKNNPKTTFILAHVASCAENLRAVAGWLDELPNMYVDIAARIGELGRQPYTAKWFLEKYADRILFGTDMAPGYDLDVYRFSYRFTETMDEYFSYDTSGTGMQGRWQIYGVGLSDEVLRKIYHENADRLIG